MEEKKHTGGEHLSEMEKDLLDEFILDIKNMDAIIPLHEENNRIRYDKAKGAGASLKLLIHELNYVLANGDFSVEQRKKLMDFINA